MKPEIIALLFAPAATLTAPMTAEALAERQAQTSIHELIVGKGKLYFGAATEMKKFEGKEEAILKNNFGQVTPENSLKWWATEPSRGQFTFEAADELVDWATKNAKSIRGHTLLWYKNLPKWVEDIKDKQELTKVIQTHVTTLVGRYKSRIRAWDVVNEIFEEDGALRSWHIYNVLGEDFVRIAFEAARAADPQAKLYYNDYNLENASYGQLKNGVVPYVKKWIQQGIPIDGIGSQSHLNAGRSGSMKGALDALAGTGVEEVAITELDIKGASSSDYWAVAHACMQVSKCIGITTWGVSDKDSPDAKDTPLLFDTNYEPKNAYYAAADAIRNF